MPRLLHLTLRTAWSSKVKFILLVLMVAVSIVVFLVVSELSRVSSQDLDEAIATESGDAGTYAVELGSAMGLGRDELAHMMETALAPIAAGELRMVEVYPAVVPECPPFEALGMQQLLVMRDASARPLQMGFGTELPVDTLFCIDGQRIPADAIYMPTEAEQRQWGTGVFVDHTYARLVRYSSTEPTTYRFVVVTGTRTDLRDDIEQGVAATFHDTAARVGLRTAEVLHVRRVDTGDAVRDASEGVKLVYGFVGWGVLLLGALGLLVAELIVVRDRAWFYGLMRALGADSRHIAALVILDVALVLVAGSVLMVFLASALQPAAEELARSAFGVDVELLNVESLPRLVLGILVLLGLASAGPAVKAVRQDPIDVLEGR